MSKASKLARLLILIVIQPHYLHISFYASHKKRSGGFILCGSVNFKIDNLTHTGQLSMSTIKIVRIRPFELALRFSCEARFPKVRIIQLGVYFRNEAVFCLVAPSKWPALSINDCSFCYDWTTAKHIVSWVSFSFARCSGERCLSAFNDEGRLPPPIKF